jgi:hypothetical protein
MSVEFTLECLTPRQMILADIIWACPSGDAVKTFIKGLPNYTLRKEATSIVELMKMAAIEQCYDGIVEPLAAKALLDKISKQ